jgi:hypothetical protein
MAKRPGVTVKLIVRRGAVERYKKLKKKTAKLPVEVSWDRRQEERRRKAAAGVAKDRRTADRRQKPPFTWDLSDFVVVEKPRRPRKK